MTVQTVTVPLVGSVVMRDSLSLSYGQRFTNVSFISQQNELTGGAELWATSQENWTAYNQPGAASGNGTAVTIWTGNANAIATAYGTPNSTVYVDNVSYGALTGICGFLSESVNGAGVATLWAVSESNRGYYSLAGVMTLIVDVDFPPNQAPARTLTGNFVHFSGFSGIMCTDGTFWHNDVATPASWTNSAYLTAQSSPDAGVAAVAHADYIILFGRSTYEPHSNTGNAQGSVLSRVPGAARRIGLVNQYAVASIMGTLAFVGSAEGASVYVMQGLEAVRVSTHSIDMALKDNLATCRVMAFASFGRPKILVLPGGSGNYNYGFVYDIDTKLWTHTTLNFHLLQTAAFRQFAAAFSGVYGVGPNGSGNYYYLNTAATQDSVIQTIQLNFGTGRPKILHAARLIGESYTSLSFTFEYSDDGGVTFIVLGYFNLGQDLKFKLVPELRRGGKFTSREFRLSWTTVGGEMPKVKALELDIEVLA